MTSNHKSLKALKGHIQRHQKIANQAALKASKLMDEYKSCMAVVKSNNEIVSRYEFQVRQILNSEK